MNRFNWIIAWLAISSAIALWSIESTWSFNVVSDVEVKTKRLVKDILLKKYISNNELVKISNSENPDDIETDDWYIYIV